MLRTAPGRHRAGSEFTCRVLNAVRRIPPGRVATYGDIARAAGRPRAWRAVGNVMRDCTAKDVPCHRVIAAGGGLGGYGGNLALKRELLRAEGLLVVGNRIRNFTKVRWAGAKKGHCGTADGRWRVLALNGREPHA